MPRGNSPHTPRRRMVHSGGQSHVLAHKAGRSRTPWARHTPRNWSCVRIGAVHHDRTIEPCHRGVHGHACADKPIPFDEHLKHINRERDRVELTGPPSIRTEEHRPAPRPSEPRAERAPARPDVPHTEIVRRVDFVYVIPSEIATGRLIDVLL